MSNLYKTYLFKDKDPAIHTAIVKADLAWDKVAADSGVTTNTLRNWFLGPTKRPQFATLQAVAMAVGLEWKLVKGRR